MEGNCTHIIDLNKILTNLEEATAAIKQIVKSVGKVLFVATKKQAKDIVAEYVKSDSEKRPALRAKDIMTRDERMVERKKPGSKKARNRFQFSKR